MPANLPHPMSNPPLSLRLASLLLAAALVLGFAVIAYGPGALAQDGTGAATPTPPTNCIVPEATVREGDSAPIFPFPGQEKATPESTPVASPVASPMASGSARASLETDITAISQTLVACLSEGRYADVAGITGDPFRGRLLGLPEPVDGPTYASLAGVLIPVQYRIVSIVDIVGTGRGAAEATVTYTAANQLRTGTWHYRLAYTGASRRWVVDSETVEEPRTPSGAATIAVEMTNNRYRLSEDRVEGPAVKLDGTNNDEEAHELLVLRIERGANAESLLTTPGPALPEGISLVGQLTIPARSTGSLVLIDLEPGSYTVVDLLPDEEGVPHLAGGMQATFTVS